MERRAGPEALERIQEALDIYLRMPQSPNFDAEVTRYTDIAVQQYVSNVFHLRSQLALAQAILETKNATIDALQAANLRYKQLLSANPQSQGQLTGSGTGNTQGDEDIWRCCHHYQVHREGISSKPSSHLQGIATQG